MRWFTHFMSAGAGRRFWPEADIQHEVRLRLSAAQPSDLQKTLRQKGLLHGPCDKETRPALGLFDEFCSSSRCGACLPLGDWAQAVNVAAGGRSFKAKRRPVVH